MKAKCTTHSNGTFSLDLGCQHCGKPITRSGPSGMTCEDRCADKWVRWDRLGRPSYQKHLESLGILAEAMAEREQLAEQLFGKNKEAQ